MSERLRSKFLGCRGLRARSNRTVQPIREKACLLHTGLPSKCEVKHLSCCPSCDQPIADVYGEDLLGWSAGRRNQVHLIHSCRWYLQSCNLRPNGSGVLRFSPQKACRRCNNVRSLKQSGRTRVCGYADILQDACCAEEIILVTEPESKSPQVDVGHCAGS